MAVLTWMTVEEEGEMLSFRIYLEGGASGVCRGGCGHERGERKTPVVRAEPPQGGSRLRSRDQKVS